MSENKPPNCQAGFANVLHHLITSNVCSLEPVLSEHLISFAHTENPSPKTLVHLHPDSDRTPQDWCPQMNLTERQRTRSESSSATQLPQLDRVASLGEPKESVHWVVAFPVTPFAGAVSRTSQVPFGRFRVVWKVPAWSANFWFVSNLR